MNRLLFIAAILISFSASAADRITARLTFTNETMNGYAFTMNGSARTWTNNVALSTVQVLTNSTAAGSKTNLYNQVALNPFSQVTILNINATNIDFVGASGLAMQALVSGGYGFVTYSTQTVATLTAVRIPVSGEASAAVRTNVSSSLVDAVETFSTNSLNQNSVAASELVGLTNAQSITGAKAFTNLASHFVGGYLKATNFTGAIGSLSNGVIYSPGISNPSLTNSTFYGGTFVGIFSGDASELAATNIFANVISGNGESVIQLTTHLAAEDGIIFYGNASGLTNIPIASLDDASRAAIVYSGTTNNLRSGSDISFGRYALSSLAAGANSAIPVGTNVFVELSGPGGAAFSIAGIAGGRDGKFLILYNNTGGAMTMLNESGLDSTAANRILTPSASDLVLRGRSSVTLIYSASASRWVVINSEASGTGTGSAYFACNTNATIATSSSTNTFSGWTYSMASGTIGTLTNTAFVVTNAGNYKIDFGAGLLGTTSDVIQMMVYTNGVHCGIVWLGVTMPGASPASETGFKAMNVTLPANCIVEIRISNSDPASTTLANGVFSIIGLP